MRSCIEKPTLRVEQGVGSRAVGATPAELVRGGLNESDPLFIVLFALTNNNFHLQVRAFFPILSIFVFALFLFMGPLRQELRFKWALWSIIK